MSKCQNCKRVFTGIPRKSNGMGKYCGVCIPNCKTCGKPVDFLNASKCNLCWEVEHRIDDYLQSPSARLKVKRKLDSYL